MDFYFLFGYLATYSTLLPVAIGLYRFRNSAIYQRGLLLLLSIGFVIDCVNPLLADMGIKYLIYHLWSVSESLFIFWFLKRVSETKSERKLCMAGLIATIPVWLACLWFSAKFGVRYNPVFDTLISIGISFISALILLRFTREKSTLLSSTNFWLVGGIFFYFFCSDFIFGLMASDFLKRIWFIADLVVIFGYLILAIGFWLIKKDETRPE